MRPRPKPRGKTLKLRRSEAVLVSSAFCRMQCMRTVLATVLALTLLGEGAALAQARPSQATPPQPAPSQAAPSQATPAQAKIPKPAAPSAPQPRPAPSCPSSPGSPSAPKTCSASRLARAGSDRRRHGPARRDDHPAAHPGRQGGWPDAHAAGGPHPGSHARVHHRRVGDGRRAADEQPQGVHHRRGGAPRRLPARLAR